MTVKILWTDDEIDLLKPHILFLEEKGYRVFTATNGDDALEMFEEERPHIVFLDENMPGMSGLEVLTEMKAKQPSIPVVMITKSEEESIMEEAIGSKISDYLIKPVNPKQILLSIKKNLDQSRLISDKTTSGYQQDFRRIGMKLTENLDLDEWKDLYREMVNWELELENSKDQSMNEVLEMQKREANDRFSRFVEDNYLDWVNDESDDSPTMSHNVFKRKVAPELQDDKKTFLIVIDNLRYDQWKVFKPLLESLFTVKKDEIYNGIVPSTTHYARNAIFSGLMPSRIARMFPKMWKSENEEGGKNNHEEEFLSNQMMRLGIKQKTRYNKVTTLSYGKKLSENFHELLDFDFNVIVYNFVDMLSHARTEMEVLRELADDESAYRSLTMSWFRHSPLYEIIKQIADHKGRMIITTDHGSIRVHKPVKVIGDRNTNTNLRYKTGKALSYKDKEVFTIKNPDDGLLPKSNVSSIYLFARDETFFAYPNNFNHYVKYYKNTFQHGGISLEELLIPFAVME